MRRSSAILESMIPKAPSRSWRRAAVWAAFVCALCSSPEHCLGAKVSTWSLSSASSPAADVAAGRSSEMERWG
eukprot:5660203-Pyramimonas_sp.AAC.1